MINPIEPVEKTAKAPKSISMINRAQVKKMALRHAKEKGRKFTRVGSSFLDEVERLTRENIASMVHRHPSKGKTLL